MSLKIGQEEEFTALFEDVDFLSSLNIKAPSLEGYVYPATYRFSKIPSAERVIREAVKSFFEKLPADYEKRVGDMGLTLQQALTFASLIELETPNRDEKPLVSEVIWRRLKKKIALGIDASIIYGIKDYKGNISRSHLKDKSNPYNTRMHPGLPPSPICSPSAESLRAVLEPTEHGYLYYVLDPDTPNRHHFSKTLKEHNQYVRKLVRASRAKRGQK